MPVISASPAAIDEAAVRLREGRLVAFPTETVYGLGAHALDADAVSQIYALKGRPAFNPLIVHVADVEGARQLTQWNERAQRLAEAFWPGPLTLVLPRKPGVPDAVTAGLSTVAVRVPAHPLALELLQKARIPVAAPSANRSTQISPTRAAHVVKSLGEQVWVLDGGECKVGLESTVLDLSGARAAILRPGALGARELEPFIGPLAHADEVKGEAPRSSPGQMERHYAPRARVRLFSNLADAHFHAVLLGQGLKIGVLAFAPTEIDSHEIILPDDPARYGAGLYGALHQLEDAGVGLILIEDVPDSPNWDAVRDRLKRAAFEG